MSNPRHDLFEALDRLDTEVGSVPHLGSRGVRKQVVTTMINNLYPKPFPKTDAERLGQMGFLLWKFAAENEEDWDGDSYTFDDFMSFTTEDERNIILQQASVLEKLLKGN